jgi:hypothetical protein
MNIIKFTLTVFCMFFLVNKTLLSETMTDTYESGLVLQFIPMGDTEPLGTMIDKNTIFMADSFKKNQALVKYSEMPHWLLWQGFYKAEKSGKYVFVVNGKSSFVKCKFEASLAGNKLFSLSGRLSELYEHKTLNLEEGVHKFEASLSCPTYSKDTFVAIEIKKPGESVVGKMNVNEFLHRK